MKSRNTEPGDLNRLEEAALEDEVRRGILDLIGLDLVRIKELEEEMDLKEQDLKNHLVMPPKCQASSSAMIQIQVMQACIGDRACLLEKGKVTSPVA